MFRYCVYKISYSEFAELLELNLNSKIEIYNFLKRRTRDIMAIYTDDDRFRSYDDAETFATIVYKHDNSGNIIAIYDLAEKNWITFFIL